MAVELTLFPSQLQVGDSLLIEAMLRSEDKHEQRLVVDYAIHQRKANGRLSPKTFKLRTIDLGPGGESRLTKKHDFSPITVRRYYPGEHVVELSVAGRPLARRVFQLNLDVYFNST